MKDILAKTIKLNKQARIVRLIELALKANEGKLSASEMIELSSIQAIREGNGECDEVRKMRGD